MNAPRFAYLAFMLLAVGVFFLARRLAPATPGVTKLPRRQKLWLAFAAFVGGVFGGKFPFLFDAGGPLAIATWSADGKSITTALIGAYLAVELTKAWLGIRIKTGDSWAFPLTLSLAVGRWGCFFNGCCYGQPCDLPWAVDFGDGVPRHPTQVYESLFHLGMAGIVLWLTFTNRLVTHRLQFYLIAYGIFRCITEYIRPEPRDLFGLTFYQWAAAALALGLALQWEREVARNRPGQRQ